MIRSLVTPLAAAADHSAVVDRSVAPVNRVGPADRSVVVDRSGVAVLRAVAPNVAPNAVQTVRRFLTDETQPAVPDVVLNVAPNVAQIVVLIVAQIVVQCAVGDCYAARDYCAAFRSPAGHATASQLLPASSAAHSDHHGPEFPLFEAAPIPTVPID